MTRQVEDIDFLIKEIQSLLSLQHSNNSIDSLLQWTLGHPIVRQQQLSLAFYSLSPRMEWEVVSACGNATFKFSPTLPDCIFTEQVGHDALHPWGYFYPRNALSFSHQAASLAGMLDSLGHVLGLVLGEGELLNGLFLFASSHEIDPKIELKLAAFLRVSAEFIYQHFFAEHTVSKTTSGSQSSTSHSIHKPAVESAHHSGLDIELTDRQRQVLQLIADGATNEEIASAMHLSLGTIRVETSRLYDRLGARNRQQAATFAYLVQDN